MEEKLYTEKDLELAIEMARETESVRRGALSEEWDEVYKFEKDEIVDEIRRNKNNTRE